LVRTVKPVTGPDTEGVRRPVRVKMAGVSAVCSGKPEIVTELLATVQLAWGRDKLHTGKGLELVSGGKAAGSEM